MSDLPQPIRINFATTVPGPTRRDVARWANDALPSQAEFPNAPDGLGFIDPVTGGTLVAALVNVVMLLIMLEQRAAQKKKAETWDLDQIRKVVETQLAERGVVSAQLKEIKGFKDFQSGLSNVFKVTAIDSSNKQRFDVYVIREDKAYTLSLNDPT